MTCTGLTSFVPVTCRPNVCYSEDTDNSSSSDVSSITHHFKTASQVCEESETAYRCKTT